MKRGRKPHTPTDEQRRIVENLSGFGIPQERICKVIGITRDTLRLHYRDELDRASGVVESNLIGNLMRIAMGSDGTALKAIMFSLQSRFKWAPYQQPHEPRPEAVGKKEQQVQHAHVAHENTDWNDLVDRLN